MNYSRTHRYLVAFDGEPQPDQLLTRTYLGEKVVLFREPDGTPKTLRDRCPHRFAPLSAGKLVGTAFRCGYHDLTSDATDSCVRNTHGPAPRVACVKPYAVRERDCPMWNRRGEAASADDTLIPDHDTVAAAPVCVDFRGRLPPGRDAVLQVDNILDLSQELREQGRPTGKHHRLLAFVLGVLGAAGVHAAEKIPIGMSAPLTGVLASYGRDLEKGVKLGIAQVNAAGGIGGRELELMVKDDAGGADRAVANTKALIETGVYALTGYHGSVAIEASLPLIEQSGTPLIGVASSAELLREPPLRNVFNLRAGAREEAAAMVLHLDTIGLTEIAAIAQDDALGTAALDGLQLELTRLAVRPQALVRMSSAADVMRSVQAACKDKPQALVLGLNAADALAVIRHALKSGCMPHFYVMSEAGAELLAIGATSKELAGVIVSQVVPHPRSSSIPVAADYLRLAGASASYAGLEGFIYARVIAAAFKACAGHLQRNCVIAALESKPIDVGGYRVQFSPGDRRGSRFVEMTIVTADGRFRR